MSLDLDTLMICSMLVTSTCGLLFLSEAFRRRETASSFWWGIAFFSTTVAPIFYIAASAFPTVEWIVALANGLVITGMSMIWVGAQAFNGRKPKFGAALAGPCIAIAAVVLAPRPFTAWSGSVPFLLLFSAYCLATAAEFWNHAGTRYRNAKIIAGASAIASLFYAARGITLWLTSPSDPFFLAYFSPEIATLVVMLLVIISSFSLVSIGKEQFEVALHRAATRDGLTDTLNRREFLRQAEEIHQRQAALAAPVALLLIDLDFFKNINDTHGHPVGDQVLVSFAETAASVLGTEDLLCRYGGEEFLVLMAGVTQRQALATAEEIRRRFAGIVVSTEKGEIRPTASIGMATAIAAERSLAKLISEADNALYQAKAAGRNRVTALFIAA